MDPNRVATPPELASDADSSLTPKTRLRDRKVEKVVRNSTVGHINSRPLTETPQGISFKPEHIDAAEADTHFWNWITTSECDYNKQIHDLFANRELFPKADQRSLALNNPFCNQYQGQDPEMMPPQSNSNQCVLPTKDRPSNSRKKPCQLPLQGSAKKPRTVPDVPTEPVPVGMYSDTPMRQHGSQDQMVLQQMIMHQNHQMIQQQKMMHSNLQMIQTQPNLSAQGKFVMSSVVPTDGTSNTVSREYLMQQEMQLESQNQLVLQQQQDKQQRMMPQSLLMTQTQQKTQQNSSALKGPLTHSAAGMPNAASAVGVQQMNTMQHWQQNLLELGTVMRSAAVMSSAASIMGLQQMNKQQQQQEDQKLQHKLQEQQKQQQEHQKQQLKLQEQHKQQQEQMKQQQQKQEQKKQQQQQEHQKLQEQQKETFIVQVTEIIQELDTISTEVIQFQADPDAENLLKTIMECKDKLHYLLSLLDDTTDSLQIKLSDRLSHFKEYDQRCNVVYLAKQVINNANIYLIQTRFQLRPEQPPLQSQGHPQVELLSDSNRGSILPQQTQQQQLGPIMNQSGTLLRNCVSDRRPEAILSQKDQRNTKPSTATKTVK